MTGCTSAPTPTLIGKTDGNKYHARIAFLPLEGGKRTPVVSPFTLPGDLYFVASGASQLVRRTHSGTALISSANAPNGPGWSTSVGAFMVNGILYKANSNGLLTKQTFDGTTYGTASPVNAADLLANQTDWHTDVKTITSLFYAGGNIYYTKSGTNALYRRGFETESDVVGQQRFSTTTSGINWSSVRGAFVANGTAVLRRHEREAVDQALEPVGARPDHGHLGAARVVGLDLADAVPVPGGPRPAERGADGEDHGCQLHAADLFVQRLDVE